LMLELTNRVSDHARAARDGRWTRSGEFSYRVAPIRELADKQLGIVGLGAIGGAVARIAQALGMRVVAAHSRAAASGAPAGSLSVPGSPHIERLPLEELLATSDVVSLHCPLTPQTRHLVNHERLQTMKPTALLLNTGRGALVDEDALIDALRSGSIAGAGLDVLQAEPPPPDHPLLQLERCLITPHLAWATTESIQRLLNATVENVKAFLAGHPQNVVSA
jgi:glycerate dehydrogenase